MIALQELILEKTNMVETDKYLAAWERERNYVIKNQSAIRQQYGSDFIAVKDCDVIDHDKNEFDLAGRIEKRFRGEFVLISTLERVLNPRAVILDSPEEVKLGSIEV